MKKVLSIMIMSMFVLSIAATSHAAGVEKLKRGFHKIATSPKKAGTTMAAVMEKTDAAPLGFIGGAMEAPFSFLNQAVSGMVDILTFPFDPEC